MTLRELIVDAVEKYGDYLDCQVIVQQDAEGNGYHKSFALGLAVDDEANGYPADCDEVVLDTYPDDVPPEGRVIIIV